MMERHDTGCTYQLTGCPYELSEILVFLSVSLAMNLYIKGFLETKEKAFSKNCNKKGGSETDMAVWIEKNM